MIITYWCVIDRDTGFLVIAFEDERMARRFVGDDSLQTVCRMDVEDGSEEE